MEMNLCLERHSIWCKTPSESKKSVAIDIRGATVSALIAPAAYPLPKLATKAGISTNTDSYSN